MVAGSLTYTTLLALVPLFAVTIALTARVPMVRDFILQVKSFIVQNLLPDVAGRMVGDYMEQFAQNAARLTVIGLIMIAVTAIALMFTIDGACNDKHAAKRFHHERRCLVRQMSLNAPSIVNISAIAVTAIMMSPITVSRAAFCANCSM